MTDKVSKEIRSKTMKAVKWKNTCLENEITKELWKRGIRFRRNVKDLYGKPDIAIKKYKMVIFIDSCFWHGCDLHCRLPKSNLDFWLNKIDKNKARDIEVNSYYKNIGWNILRIWEHQITEDFNRSIENIIDLFHKCKTAKGKCRLFFLYE